MQLFDRSSGAACHVLCLILRKTPNHFLFTRRDCNKKIIKQKSFVLNLITKINLKAVTNQLFITTNFYDVCQYNGIKVADTLLKKNPLGHQLQLNHKHKQLNHNFN